MTQVKPINVNHANLFAAVGYFFNNKHFDFRVFILRSQTARLLARTMTAPFGVDLKSAGLSLLVKALDALRRPPLPNCSIKFATLTVAPKRWYRGIIRPTICAVSNAGGGGGYACDGGAAMDANPEQDVEASGGCGGVAEAADGALHGGCEVGHDVAGV